ncbi:hypothetical protein DM01DRAFT_1212517 [Hesseltinella vesiculosa]|uniref:Uncharacterized protein n=1 Tax=Hesseltinella vesiculosa TaxID=101127 RepID=A0A1X2G2M5_9FUNG|nr:hypothetical protein DM01DRAFT_1212517 [Hesseltinella vesiculosa]
MASNAGLKAKAQSIEIGDLRLQAIGPSAPSNSARATRNPTSSKLLNEQALQHLLPLLSPHPPNVPLSSLHEYDPLKTQCRWI